MLRRRVATADAWSSAPQPDPRVAIAAFHRQLAAQDITLILMPTPVKPGVHPDKLAGRASSDPQLCRMRRIAQFITWMPEQRHPRVRSRRRFSGSPAVGAAIPRHRHALAARGDGARRRAAGRLRQSARDAARCAVAADSASRSRRSQIAATPPSCSICRPDSSSIHPSGRSSAACSLRTAAVALGPQRGRARARRQLRQHLFAGVDGLG